MSFRPYVRRSTRIYNYWDATIRWLIRDHSEKVIFGGVFGGLDMPYYRGNYDVVRPSHPRALLWRVPEDYPAPYLTNRETEEGLSYKRDYGFKQKLEK